MLSMTVLAVSQRPKFLHELLGQDKLVTSLLHQEAVGRLPHFFIIAGEIGIGKTTLARIIANGIQLGFNSDKIDRSLDIREINAANENSVDFVRKLIEIMKYRPNNACRAKVVIMDEAHQLTSPAQNALLKETEDTANHAYYIFCTSIPNKIVPALRRRAFIVTPELFDDATIQIFVKNSVKNAIDDSNSNIPDDVAVFTKCLLENEIRAPGLILQCLERYLSGLSPREAVTFGSSENKVNTLAICQAMVKGKGNWKPVASLVKGIDKSELFATRACILGYLKTVLLRKSDSVKAIPVAKAIKIMGDASVEEVPLFLSSICLATAALEIMV